MRHTWLENIKRIIMVTYNKQDLINFPINTYVEVLDWDNEPYALGTVIGITHNYKFELFFQVKETSGATYEYHPSRLRRISNV